MIGLVPFKSVKGIGFCRTMTYRMTCCCSVTYKSALTASLIPRAGRWEVGRNGELYKFYILYLQALMETPRGDGISAFSIPASPESFCR